MWLLFYVEGQTEAAYVQRVLRRHLANFGVMVMGSVLVQTKRRRGRVHRGGGRRYRSAREELARLLKQHKGRDVRFTTMFDLYGLYADFPAIDAAAAQRHDPYARVKTLEAALAQDVGDSRLIPYVQLHEFEAILFCDPTVFARIFENAERGIAELSAVRAAAASPERINDGDATAPSKRILQAFPQFDKLRDGLAAAELIALDIVRSQCPHFAAWLERLESLAGARI